MLFRSFGWRPRRIAIKATAPINKTFSNWWIYPSIAFLIAIVAFIALINLHYEILCFGWRDRRIVTKAPMAMRKAMPV